MNNRLPPRPPRPPKETLSRRDVLIALGMLGATGVIATGGLATALVLLARRQQNPDPTPLAPLTRASVVPNPSETPPVGANTPIATSPPLMVSRQEWGASAVNLGARYEKGLYSEENPEGWRIYDNIQDIYRTVVVHHSVIYEADDISSVKKIQNLHQTDREWADIGYHFLVGKDGMVYEGRDLKVRGTHTASYNTGTVGVCLIGNFSEDNIGDAQWQGLGRILFWLVDALPLTYLAGHRDFNPETECPGNNLWFSLDQLATAVGLKRGTEGYTEPVLHHGTECTCGIKHL